ncbi:arylesterase [Sphingobacterium alkalisoli]|uniref:Arylesterase n=1 Tax=Sphingobacterium alkalisoli TaxID=1874115 RepID=A0A4U0GWJ8_9SPHI|nr:arylesterase [Sphingobacterium alkalisoli]TJY63418.1 arylesterase [Sphingobacterium alkalisoli]GGH25946.1 arylesterase [Sphingobacterium alkalisoli]
MISIIRTCTFLFFITSLFSCNGTGNTEGGDRNDELNKNSEEIAEKRISRKLILFFGNSLTAGYGLDGQEDAFPALIQAKIDSLKLPYDCINAGLSGETSAGGKERIDWLLKQPIDIFVLELGANDGLRGIPNSTTYENLSNIIEKVKKANPKCKLVLAGMMVPPSMGKTYFDNFKDIYPRLADEYDMALVPFLLDKVAGIENLNQTDGVHPTDEGQKIVAENVWPVLKPLLD